jgi:hypothetical protein
MLFVPMASALNPKFLSHVLNVLKNTPDFENDHFINSRENVIRAKAIGAKVRLHLLMAITMKRKNCSEI